jgi:hypothetical protein
MTGSQTHERTIIMSNQEKIDKARYAFEQFFKGLRRSAENGFGDGPAFGPDKNVTGKEIVDLFLALHPRLIQIRAKITDGFSEKDQFWVDSDRWNQAHSEIVRRPSFPQDPVRLPPHLMTASDPLCIPVEFCYNRNPMPKSREWDMACKKASDKPANQSPGIMGEAVITSENQVSIFIAVPCNEKGDVDNDMQGHYEDIADTKFIHLQPDAVLV